jgi:hypothetical protein
MQAVGAHLPARQLRAWLLTPCAELNDLSPGAHGSRARRGIQAIISLLEHAPAADAARSDQPPDTTG